MITEKKVDEMYVALHIDNIEIINELTRICEQNMVRIKFTKLRIPIIIKRIQITEIRTKLILGQTERIIKSMFWIMSDLILTQLL